MVKGGVSVKTLPSNASRQDQQPQTQRLGHEAIGQLGIGRECLPVLHQFDPDHQTGTADFSDTGMRTQSGNQLALPAFATI